MPRYTITTQRQIDWLRITYPRSPNRYSWAIGFSADCTSRVLSQLLPLGERQKLKPWWDVVPLNLPE